MPNDIELIKSRLDIVDVVGEYVRLKQSGQNWKGLCPFHGEKTPSFMVHREKQIWHCFGCGEGGDAFSFVQRIENIEFPEALEMLARKAGVELTRAGRDEAGANQRVRLFRILEAAAKFYERELKEGKGASKAQAYVRERGITEEAQAAFRIGYAPADWDRLTVALKNKGVSLEELTAAGVTQPSDRGGYDRFRDRLMFPITDVQGRVVGFGGRTLDPQAKEALAGQAKYINSPQGPAYNKSLIVYNLDRAKTAIKEAGYAVLVEGYMDVVGCWQAGIRNVAATSGTALTPEQVKLLKRYAPEVRLAFDADLAGSSATERGIDQALSAELEVKVIRLPQGKDPDDAARADAEGLKRAIQEALPIGEHTLRRVLAGADLSASQGVKAASDAILKSIGRLPNVVERDYYLKQAARELKVNENSLRERLAKLAVHPAAFAAEPETPRVRKSREEMQTERLLVLVLAQPDQLPGLGLSAELLPEGPAQDLYTQLMLQYTEAHRLDPEALQRELARNPETQHLFDALTLAATDAAHEGAQEAARELASIVRDIKIRHLKAQLKQLQDAIRAAEAAGMADHTTLLERFADVSGQLSSLERESHAQSR